MFREELSELIQMAVDHGITLLIQLTPISGEAVEHSPTLRAWAEDLESKNPNVIVGRPEVLLYDPGVFFDEVHLGSTGAKMFTSFVAKEVKDLLAGGVDRMSHHSPSEKRPQE